MAPLQVGVEHALNWLLEHAEDADLNEPLRLVSARVQGSLLRQVNKHSSDSARAKHPKTSRKKPSVLVVAGGEPGGAVHERRRSGVRTGRAVWAAGG